MSKARLNSPPLAYEARDADATVEDATLDSDVLISVQVMTLSTLMRRGAALAYRRELGLGYNEWRVISVVGFHGPLSHKELAEHLVLDKGQVSREVTELAGRGLLSRARARRTTQISLTPAGTALFRHLNRSARERNLHFLGDLGESERAQLFVMLRSIRARALDLLREEQEAGRDESTG